MDDDSKNSDSNLVLEKISWKITGFCGLVNKRREVQVGERDMCVYKYIYACVIYVYAKRKYQLQVIHTFLNTYVYYLYFLLN